MVTVGQENPESEEYSLTRKCQTQVVCIVLRLHRQGCSSPLPRPTLSGTLPLQFLLIPTSYAPDRHPEQLQMQMKHSLQMASKGRN